MITAALFDVDGTLLDTRVFIFQAFQHVFDYYNEPYDVTRLTVLMGKPLEEVYQQVLPHRPVAEAAQRHRDFQGSNMDLIKVFPDTIGCLTMLRQRGMKIAVVTTRKRNGLASLEHAGVATLLNVVITGDDVTKFKPDPEALHQALEIINIKPQAAVMVGDSDVDIIAGQRAGTRTIGVTWGFSTSSTLRRCQPDAMINSIDEMTSLIDQW